MVASRAKVFAHVLDKLPTMSQYWLRSGRGYSLNGYLTPAT